MCNLYSAGPAPHEDHSEWERHVRKAVSKIGVYRVFPGNEGVVARLSDGAPEASLMSWGFERDFANRPVNNSRDDKLAGRMWGKAFRERRCVIPARWFVEWHPKARTAQGYKQPLAIRKAPDSWLWIAGVWEERQGRAFYSMVTTSANDQLAEIHNRMPALLDESEIEPYLTTLAPLDFIRPFAGPLEILEISSPTDSPDNGPPKAGDSQNMMTF